MGKGRRVVEYAGTAPGKQAGRGPRLWAYSYQDLANLLGTTVEGLKARAKRRTFRPGDLESVFEAWLAVKQRSTR